MRKTKPTSLKRKVIFAAATGLMAIGAATPAIAVPAGGGDWYYGVSVCCNWSRYYHNGVNHGASVRNGDGLVRSACVAPGQRAEARQGATLTGNQAFWRHC